MRVRHVASERERDRKVEEEEKSDNTAVRDVIESTIVSE